MFSRQPVVHPSAAPAGDVSTVGERLFRFSQEVQLPHSHVPRHASRRILLLERLFCHGNRFCILHLKASLCCALGITSRGVCQGQESDPRAMEPASSVGRSCQACLKAPAGRSKAGQILGRAFPSSREAQPLKGPTLLGSWKCATQRNCVQNSFLLQCL